jgi:hypothetical protein
LGGACMYVTGTRVGPAVMSKGGMLNGSISTATVSQADGTVTATAP